MDNTDRLTLLTLMLALRQRLVEASDQRDQKTLSELRLTFTIITEASYSCEDKAATLLFQSLWDSAREAGMGVGWKAPIPSEAEIRDILSAHK